MEVKLRKAEGLNKSKKGRQNSHNKTTHKYEKQSVRTAKNKARNIREAERLHKKAYEKLTARRLWVTALCW